MKFAEIECLGVEEMEKLETKEIDSTVILMIQLNTISPDVCFNLREWRKVRDKTMMGFLAAPLPATHAIS